eukprot:CAMPEP_0174289814 /NCGR_PEP_ID=MMETSP0809-20121228/26485_1 /TAXON_ID=73025 ORGANISM="Eutreptiella gymnastica-like, Strain CCMP1594" /NCGR_SAMPLE_ID=MMETSP0809 /ASSEMBLY_ACC=CAM_ASM_000658 /LENGTH=38 /DNA_ID= /DNA_START= /DNA_END= /DNA_ORIENTATION=
MAQMAVLIGARHSLETSGGGTAAPGTALAPPPPTGIRR